DCIPHPASPLCHTLALLERPQPKRSDPVLVCPPLVLLTMYGFVNYLMPNGSMICRIQILRVVPPNKFLMFLIVQSGTPVINHHLVPHDARLAGVCLCSQAFDVNVEIGQFLTLLMAETAEL